MNSNEIRQLANKAGFDTGLNRDGSPFVWTLFKDSDNFYNEIKNFAKLVIAKEREACAKVAENRFLNKASCTTDEAYELLKKSIANDIRARSIK